MTHATDGAARELQRGMIELVRAFGLHQPDRTPCGQPVTVSQAHALMELDTDGPMAQAELVRRLELHPSATSRLVHGLLQRGWVDQRPDPADRRRRRLSLSAAGASVARSLDEARAGFYERISHELSAADLATTLESLAVLASAMRAARDDTEET